MGVTIDSKNHSIDMGYGGFNNLRTKVAELTGKEIFEHYKNLEKGMWLFGEERKEFFEKYNKKISEIHEKYNVPDGIFDFLYASDCGGSISVEACKQIWEVIKDYDDNILYGYIGRPDCAKFRDFKEIIKDCIENQCKLKWF